MHADEAAVNINFWVNDDDANLDTKTSGGLNVFKSRPDLGAAHEDINNNDPAVMARLKEELEGKDMLKVGFKKNRMVFFTSDMFHESDTFNFKKGYKNRRINVTLLFGKRMLKKQLDAQRKRFFARK